MPSRRPVRRAAAIATGVAAGALAARTVTFRAARQTRHSNFYGSISLPAVGTQSYASWDDEIADLFEKIGKLQEAAMLPAVGEDLDEINTLVGRLPADLQSLRQRGYVHQSELEEKTKALTERWDGMYERVADALYQQQTALVDAANRLLDTVDRLYDASANRGTVDTCWAGVRSLQSRIEAAHNTLVGMYDDFGKELEEIDANIDRLEWMLGQVEVATFQLHASEAPLRAGSARWVRQGDDEGPVGILYLTDQRLLFEQKEEVTTEKFLFIKLKSEKIHEFQFDVRISSVEEVTVGDQRGGGLLGMGKMKTLELMFDHTAPLDNALFILLKDDPAVWEATIGRAKSGEIDKSRTGEAAAEAEVLDQALREIPENCPNCAAPIEQEIVRGMDSLTCKFCGTTIRI